MKPVCIGATKVGPGQPCFLVAEIGINHNGDLKLARKMIEAAARAGADAVKVQNYRTEDFIGDRTLTYRYAGVHGVVVESQFEMFKRCELSGEDLRQLKEYAEAMGVVFHSTPTSEAGVRELVALGVPVLKNGSDYLTHLPLIRYMGSTGLPTVISTGMATVAEIDEAVRAFRQTGNEQLILLHCTSSYPTPPEEVHLRKIPTLAACFDCLVGFSDHTVGMAAAVGARVLGACWIEKHFTLSKELPGPDQWFSADPEEFRALVAAVRAVEKSLGQAGLGPASSEAEGRRQFRLSCVAARPLQEGQVLEAADIAFRRPGTGLPPRERDLLVGRRLGRSVPQGHIFTAEDFVA